MKLTIDDLRIAIMWLEANEGEGEERASCQKVAAFLEKQLERKKKQKEQKRLKAFVKRLFE